jgi:hypothetical protein
LNQNKKVASDNEPELRNCPDGHPKRIGDSCQRANSENSRNRWKREKLKQKREQRSVFKDARKHQVLSFALYRWKVIIERVFKTVFNGNSAGI